MGCLHAIVNQESFKAKEKITMASLILLLKLKINKGLNGRSFYLVQT